MIDVQKMSMQYTDSSIVRLGTALVAAAAMIAACGLRATPAAAQPGLPSYATGEERISGRIVALHGKDRLEVRDDRGFIDNVSLHDGTIINPTGLRLAPGQSVTVLGRNSGKTFEANEIDTPYASYGALPAYPYGYVPYGYYPYPYAYRVYPAFGIGFRERGFGVRGWF